MCVLGEVQGLRQEHTASRLREVEALCQVRTGAIPVPILQMSGRDKDWEAMTEPHSRMGLSLGINSFSHMTSA